MSVDRIFSAIEKRAKLGVRSCLRLVDGVGDGLPGVYLEKFDRVAVLNLHEGEAGLVADSKLGAEIARAAQVETVYAWNKQKRAKETTAAGAKVIHGDALPELIIEEGPLRFLVRPERTPSAGLFLDTREIRAELLAECRGKKVLNTFCFTGSLGIAALAGGAVEVIQVDISKGILEWAKENLALNQKSNMSGQMRFICEDVREFLKREGRRVNEGKAPYDVVIVDPPSFGSGKKASFSLRKDFAQLIELSLAILGEKSTFICTANAGDFSAEDIRRKVQELAGARFTKFKLLLPPKGEFSSAPGDSIALRGVIAS